MGWHKEWRKLAKKMIRKRKRSCKAKERDEKKRKEEEKLAQSPSFQIWLKEQEDLEKHQEEEEERIRLELHSQWLHEEELAKQRWQKQQEKLEQLKAQKAKEELIINEEWEREQQKLKEEAEMQEQKKKRKEQEEAALMDRIDKYVMGESEKLPSSARTVTESRPGCMECPFFSKVAACRFRENCSRNHIRPSISHTILFPGFYTNFRMDYVNQSNEYDTDVGLEFDDKEIYDDFLNFYDDVLTELKTYGPVVQFKVCCNEEPHLRGNVLVQYSSKRYSIKAFRALQGRYYGGKQISAEFCNIPSWGKALCGFFKKNKCPKGNKCNFLHTFKNPNGEFYKADRDIFDDYSPVRDIIEKTDWNWSPSPEPMQRSTRKQKCEIKENTPNRYSEHKHRKNSSSENEIQRKRKKHSKNRKSNDKKLIHKNKKKRKSRSRSRSKSMLNRKSRNK